MFTGELMFTDFFTPHLITHPTSQPPPVTSHLPLSRRIRLLKLLVRIRARNSKPFGAPADWKFYVESIGGNVKVPSTGAEGGGVTPWGG